MSLKKHGVTMILAAVLALLFLLTACTKGGDNPTGDTSTPGTSENPASDFEYENDAALGGIVIKAYKGISDNIQIPEKINGKPVVGISDFAFVNCNSLVSVTIPNSVTYVGERAFMNCQSLKTVTMPYSGGKLNVLVVIDENGEGHTDKNMFEGCNSLESVTVIVSENVTEISMGAFENISQLTNIKIHNGVTKIEWGAFKGCTSLESIVIPDSVTEIGGSVFMDCTSLKSISFYDSLIMGISGGYYFDGCVSLERMNITYTGGKFDDEVWYGSEYMGIPTNANLYIIVSESATAIADIAFKDCTRIMNKTIAIPDSVMSIGNSAFMGCNWLTSVTLGKSVATIGDNAFSDCANISSINIPDSVTAIGSNAFSKCTALTSIAIPDGVAKIENLTFYGCESLKSVTISDGVTEIGDNAFYLCKSLTNVTIPDSVKKIGQAAFHHIPNLTATYKGKTYTATAPDKENWSMPDEFYNAINNG